MALAGEKQVAFVLGTGPSREVAIASSDDGRIVTRLQATKGLALDSLDASSDGKILYYTSAGSIWSLSSGQTRKLTAGDCAVVAPGGKSLIVQRNGTDGSHLFQFNLETGAEQTIPFSDPVLRLFPSPLSPQSFLPGGRLLVSALRADSSFLLPAILDMKTGMARAIPAPNTSDTYGPAAAGDGRVFASAMQFIGSLWRFQRLKP